MRYASWIAAIVVTAVFSLRTNAGLLDKPLNVVLICLDTVRYDAYWLPETANLDDPLREWHTRAVRFRDVQSAAPWTVPSVASVMTGRYPLHHNAGRFAAKVADLNKEVPSPLPAGIPTFSEKLDRYFSAAFISNPFLLSQSGILRVNMLQYVKKSDDLTRDGIGFMHAHLQGRPFFLYLHYMDAHTAPYGPIDEVRAMERAIDPSLRSAIVRRAPANICAADGEPGLCDRYVVYVNQTLRMRGYVASVLRELEKRELLDRTVVIVFSDHGEEFHEHLEEERALHADPRDAYGQGHGHTLYQELLHVPVVVWHPGWKSADVTTTVSLADIAPSILAWTNQPAMPVDGVAWTDPQALNEADEPRVLLSSGIAYGPERAAARVGPWVRIVGSPDHRLLFSLRRDPAEKTPYKNAAAFREVDDTILAYLHSSTDKVKPANASRELLKDLQSLGYLSGNH